MSNLLRYISGDLCMLEERYIRTLLTGSSPNDVKFVFAVRILTCLIAELHEKRGILNCG